MAVVRMAMLDGVLEIAGEGDGGIRVPAIETIAASSALRDRDVGRAVI